LLKRRHDELGKFLDSVKAYMGYEQNVLTQVTQLRRQITDAKDDAARMQGESELTPLVGRLLAVAENYPQLRASEQFSELQNDIADLEMQIAHRRELYNDTVNTNNVHMAQFPDMLLAGIAGLHRRDLFVASDDDKKDVNVGAILA
jgi:LemA protein